MQLGVICGLCHREINTTTETYYQWIEGFTKIRKGGGPNQIADPTRRAVFRCNTCLGKKHAEIPGQLSIDDV